MFFAALLSAIWLSIINGNGNITGYGQYENLFGSPSLGYRQLYEVNLFLSATGDNNNPQFYGPSARLGAPPKQPIQYNGYYYIQDLSPTTSTNDQYSIYINQPLFYIRPKVLSEINITDDKLSFYNISLSVDYSCEFRVNKQWTIPSKCWYQTFKALGTSLSGVGYVLAGNTATSLKISLLKDNGNSNPSNWQNIITVNNNGKIGANTDNWVRFRSGDAPLIPDNQYAIGICSINDTQSFQPYKRDKDSLSYKYGAAYDNQGNKQSFDLNYVIFTDNDNTKITLNKRSQGSGDLINGYWSTKWSQSFTSKGISLAAVDVLLAGANNDWNLTIKWSIYECDNGIKPEQGKLMGNITKNTMAAYQAAGIGLHGVSYNKDEILLITGIQYCIVWEIVNPPSDSDGFNPCISDDGYNGGHGWLWNNSKWIPQNDVTVSMTIMEYSSSN